MPSRWLCILITLFWLGTTGPLLWREIRPWFLTRQPPPYTFDLLDQTQGDANHPIRWKVYTGEKEPEQNSQTHQAESWVRFHPQDETYTLHTRMIAGRGRTSTPLAFGPISMREVTIVERVQKSDLRMVALDMDMEFDALIFQKARVKVTARLEGTKLKGQFETRIGLPLLDGITELPEIEPPNNGAIQIPLHLVNRISGLQPGMSWDVPMIDPLKTVQNYAAGSKEVVVRNVVASVSAKPEPLPGHPELICHIITYDTDTNPRIYVQVGTDMVLRQESSHEGTRFVIERLNLYPDR